MVHLFFVNIIQMTSKISMKNKQGIKVLTFLRVFVSIVVSISACHAGDRDRGSIPAGETLFCMNLLLGLI